MKKQKEREKTRDTETIKLIKGHLFYLNKPTAPTLSNACIQTAFHVPSVATIQFTA